MKPGDKRFFRVCAADGCNRPVLPPRRKCTACLASKMKVTQGKPVTKGSNARGTCLHKPDKSRTKRPKRQNPGGNVPQVSKTRWGV
jgi:hypothetical protein